MAINRGGLAALYNGTTKIADCTNATVSAELGLRDATTKDSSTWVDNLEGLASWSMTGEFYFDEGTLGDDDGADDLFTLLSGRTSLTAMYSPEVSGDSKYSGTGYVTSWSKTSGIDSDNESYSITITGTGALTQATV